jgi:hypothetical protein
VRIELLLDHRLCPRLLARRLMFRLKLHATGFANSYDRDVLDPLDDPKIALGHDLVSHRYGNVWMARIKLAPHAAERAQWMELTDTFDTSTLPVIERLSGEGRLHHNRGFPSCTFVTSVVKPFGGFPTS